MIYYSRSENKKGEKEILSDHLKKTAELAEKFAGAFGEGTAGKLCGIYHDAGKASEKFQQVLGNTLHNVNHEAAGAFFLKRKSMLLARVIFAHHKGLKWDIEDELNTSYIQKDSCENGNAGRQFAVSGKEEYDKAFEYIRSETDTSGEKLRFIKENRSCYENLPEMLHARMLLSCLADADYTASASHEEEDIIESSEDEPVDPDKILCSLESFRREISENSSADPELDIIREKVYRDCLSAAEHTPGLFTLTAPTGTGKTLALLAFGARHCKLYNKRRIIFVLPFLSIIDQNARIYRRICGNVLESHSTAVYDEQTRLFAERWTSPVIVTTSVKFFESMFKYKPVDLRSLHNISDSVVIFDEAQSIPLSLLGTTAEAVNSLCRMFRCTVVFSTATQPAFGVLGNINFDPYEIIRDKDKLYSSARRVDVEWRIGEQIPEISFVNIAEEMWELKSVCCVVNRKDHSRKLFFALNELCGGRNCFHISADMCKAHRDKVINEISRRLKNGDVCRVVSTSCIEAGVDLDFENMYRALAPLDSIIQCAGRCNRNGTKRGKMTVFVPDEEKLYPSEEYINSVNCVKLLDTRHRIDINDPEHIYEYYKELFTQHGRENKKLVRAIERFDFREVEKQYKFIPDTGVSVLVPYDGELELFNELAEEALTNGITRSWIKRAAPITVTSFRGDRLRETGAKNAPVRTSAGMRKSSDWYILNDSKYYDSNTGLHFDGDSSLNYII